MIALLAHRYQEQHSHVDLSAILFPALVIGILLVASTRFKR